ESDHGTASDAGSVGGPSAGRGIWAAGPPAGGGRGERATGPAVGRGLGGAAGAAPQSGGRARRAGGGGRPSPAGDGAAARRTAAASSATQSTWVRVRCGSSAGPGPGRAAKRAGTDAVWVPRREPSHTVVADPSGPIRTESGTSGRRCAAIRRGRSAVTVSSSWSAPSGASATRRTARTPSYAPAQATVTPSGPVSTSSPAHSAWSSPSTENAGWAAVEA